MTILPKCPTHQVPLERATPWAFYLRCRHVWSPWWYMPQGGYCTYTEGFQPLDATPGGGKEEAS